MSPVDDGPVENEPGEFEALATRQDLPLPGSQPPTEERLVRFVPAERLAHWAYAVFFLLSFVSGLLLWIPSTRTWLAGSRHVFAHLHGGMGALMIGVPLVLFLLVDRRRLAGDVREIDLWDGDDRAWFWRAMRGHTLLRREMPPQGRLNAGQKANSIIVAAMAVGFAVTGSLLLAGPRVPSWLVSRALLLHQVLAAAAIVLLAGHLLHVFSTRHGRDSLRAMTRGTMSDMVARERHEKWWRRQGGCTTAPIVMSASRVTC